MPDATSPVVLLQSYLIAVAAVLLGIASLNDIATRTIPDLAPLGLTVIGVMLRVVDGTTAAALAASAAVLLVGALCWRFGWLGGGDVKLLAAATLWAGPGGTLPLLALMGLLGGLLGLFVLSPICPDFAGFRRRLPLGPSEVATGHTNPVVVPYGAAIAAAALIVTIPPSFS